MRLAVKKRRVRRTTAAVAAAVLAGGAATAQQSQPAVQEHAKTQEPPSAPTPVLEVRPAPEVYGLRPTDANYSKPKRPFPNVIAPYTPRHIGEPSFTNGPRIDQLVRNGELRLSLDDAIALALENNLDLAIQRYNLDIADTDVLRAKSGSATRGVNLGLVTGTPTSSVLATTGSQGGGPGGTSLGAGGIGLGSSGIVSSTQGVGPTPEYLDPVLSGTLSLERSQTRVTNPFSGVPFLDTNTATGNFTYTEGWVSGTDLTVTFDNSRQATNSAFNYFNPVLATTVRAQLRQHLLQGFGPDVNNRYIRLARNTRKQTDSVFRQQVIYTVSTIEDLYWDLVSAFESVKAAERALALAQQLEADNRRQVQIGTLAPIEITNAQAQVASSNQNLIVARTNLEYEQLLMKNALTRNLNNPAIQKAPVIPTDEITVTTQPEESENVETLVLAALAQRPEIEQQTIALKEQEINRHGARNALLPVVDLYGFYGGNTTAGPPNALATPCGATAAAFCIPAGLPSTGYFNALGNIFNGTAPDRGAGVNVQIIIRNRAAQADQARAVLEYRQDELRLEQLQDQIRIQVRNAQFALQQDHARVVAAQQQRQYAVESLQAEQKKYALGASTTYNVQTQQNNLASAENTLISALDTYAKDRVNLDYVLAATLKRNNISLDDAVTGQVKTLPSAPGIQPNPEANTPTRMQQEEKQTPNGQPPAQPSTPQQQTPAQPQAPGQQPPAGTGQPPQQTPTPQASVTLPSGR